MDSRQAKVAFQPVVAMTSRPDNRPLRNIVKFFSFDCGVCYCHFFLDSNLAVKFGPYMLTRCQRKVCGTFSNLKDNWSMRAR